MEHVKRRRRPYPAPRVRAPSPRQGGPRRSALEEWRRTAARAAGVPAYVVLGDAALEALASADPSDARALAAITGMGPRRQAKHASELLALIAAVPSDGYLAPTDQGGAGIPTPVQAGDQYAVRPGSVAAHARQTFLAVVRRLGAPRDRGPVDGPERRG